MVFDISRFLGGDKTDNSLKAYELVREHDALAVTRIEGRNSALTTIDNGPSGPPQLQDWPLGVGVQYRRDHFGKEVGKTLTKRFSGPSWRLIRRGRSNSAVGGVDPATAATTPDNRAVWGANSCF